MVAKKKSATSKAASEQDKLVAALRQFIRAKGQSYLFDPNVTSIGIGYRQRGGETVEELTLQFTVDVKTSEPEELEALGTAELPAAIEVAGVEVPTDVIERSYTTQFRVVAEAEGPMRKRRLDPIVPGASVGHVEVSAGTIGCIVFDKNDATPYVLSNWHVLHGPDGALGEAIVQPGPHDDNRITLNRLGTLKRSHLGIAGDCAVATIEDRQFSREIFEIGVVPEELGEPELGDKVIKSGRTTEVTHGIVRRIDTLAKIDYGEGVGEQIIGCFEIGIDPVNPPADDEVSRGGDSGSVWMFKAANGRPGKVLAGLHFGGESGNNPDEHALACLPRSGLRETRDQPAASVGRRSRAHQGIRPRLPGETDRRPAAQRSHQGRRSPAGRLRSHPLHALLTGIERVSVLRELGGLEHRRRIAQETQP
ncbi:hypothetical protein [Streptomyces sp. enrichment culture]|uniref:hypothetical protein n=1 Tax=Streptomyces sp. enrichment culture TaxID=1795815 RepID=UPI003F55C4A4